MKKISMSKTRKNEASLFGKKKISKHLNAEIFDF